MSTKKEETTTINRKYEEWPVNPIYDDIKDGMGRVLGRKLSHFEKVGMKPLRSTWIAQSTAEILNSQSESHLTRLYEVESK